MNDVLSMYDVIVANAQAYLPLFVRNSEPLNRDGFKQLFVIYRSQEGSNNAMREDDTLYSWEVFLLNVEGWY